MIEQSLFQQHLLHWFDQHGRKQLPWQINKTGYRVWISEIMLQQTQVSAVIPYYQRFMQRFPEIQSLAEASEDEVLHYWAGLGYYRRARFLHQAAQMVMDKFAGIFPDNLIDLMSLPGIGKSTAGAILAIAYQQPATILDGNVKRVLSRMLAIKDPINTNQVEKKLWEYAKYYTPSHRTGDYTQAIMDLGATLCVRSNPQCLKCPLNQHCASNLQGITALLPIKNRAKALPMRTCTFLIIKDNDTVLLEKRPPSGIWGGLWSLPELPGPPTQAAIKSLCRDNRIKIVDQIHQTAFRHTFSHYHLTIHPVHIHGKKIGHKMMEDGRQIWYNLKKPQTLGLPKPVQSLLKDLS